MNDEIKKLENIIISLRNEIAHAHSKESLNELNLKYIAGKLSLLNQASQELSKLNGEEKTQYGKKFNDIKMEIIQLIKDREEQILNSSDESSEDFDVTLPIKKQKVGRLSAHTQVIKKINEYFIYNGFSIAEGADIETDEFNFERTNLPKDHPSRDLQDTIYIESPEILLRTHTSSVETRLLSSQKPPLRFVVPGVSFRNEVLGPSNHAVFYQYQGVCVDKGISMANLKGILEGFAKHMYGSDVKTRFRNKHYPEVEPGAGMDILCKFCEGEGCAICKGRGWLEILGSGMIHRNTLERCGIDYNKWSGFAFGMGLDRITMTLTGISDVRELHSGQLVYEDTL